MDTAMRARLEAHKESMEEELDICVRFWLKNSMDRVNSGVYPAWTGRKVPLPRIRACGCRDAVRGCLPICAISMA